MNPRIFVLAAALAVAVAAAGAAPAAPPEHAAFEICAVHGAVVDPRFCADDIDRTAVWVDPFVTGGTNEEG